SLSQQPQPGARPTPEQIAEAASVLGSMRRGFRQRRRQRKFTGVLEGRRRPIGQRVVLRDGRIAELRASIRGEVVASWIDWTKVDPLQMDLFRANEVRVFRLPAARLLGSLKRGVSEVQSEKKRRACQRNGRRACKPGRQRGRPPKQATPAGTI